ncbi:MAG: hypothetical protein GTN93_02415, partial [Anaerolineae bacterium]|nr:hypothetical protein [Anaerolineae bacterium]
IYLQATILNQIAAMYCDKGDFKKALTTVKEARDMAARPEIEPGVREGYLRGCLFTETLVSARQRKPEAAKSKIEEFRV